MQNAVNLPIILILGQRIQNITAVCILWSAAWGEKKSIISACLMEIFLFFIKAVKRVLHPMNVPAHDMGIDFSGFYMGVPEKFLQNTDVNTMLQHMGGK